MDLEELAKDQLKQAQDTELRVKQITVGFNINHDFNKNDLLNITRNNRTIQYIITNVVNNKNETTLTLNEVVKPSFCVKLEPCKIIVGCRNCADCVFNSLKTKKGET